MVIVARLTGAVLQRTHGSLALLQQIGAASSYAKKPDIFPGPQSSPLIVRCLSLGWCTIPSQAAQDSDTVFQTTDLPITVSPCPGVPSWTQLSGWSDLLGVFNRSFSSSSSSASAPQAQRAPRSNKPPGVQPVSWRDFEDIGVWTVEEDASPARDTANKRTIDKPAGAQPVSWRDFEDIGVWTVEEGASSGRERAGGRTKVRPSFSRSAVNVASGADGQGTTAPAGRKVREGGHGGGRSLGGSGSVSKNSRVGEKAEASTSASSPGTAAASVPRNREESADTTWRDFEDLGAWTQDGTDEPSADEHNAKQGRVKRAVNAAAERPKPPKLTVQERKKRKKQMKAGKFVLPRFKGAYFTEQEKRFSFFDLCQLPSLRGVAAVPDFLALPDNELLAQCEVRVGQGIGGNKKHRRESSVLLRHRPTGLAVGCDKTRSPHMNKMRALLSLKEKIALQVRRRIPEGPYVPPRRVRFMVPAIDLHPDWALNRQVRVGHKTLPFLLGCQVLLDLVVCCDGDFAAAAAKMRMNELRFRRLLNMNIHVKHYVKIYKDHKKQRFVIDYLEAQAKEGGPATAEGDAQQKEAGGR